MALAAAARTSPFTSRSASNRACHRFRSQFTTESRTLAVTKLPQPRHTCYDICPEPLPQLRERQHPRQSSKSRSTHRLHSNHIVSLSKPRQPRVHEASFRDTNVERCCEPSFRAVVPCYRMSRFVVGCVAVSHPLRLLDRAVAANRAAAGVTTPGSGTP